jgi:hypothetical protein
MQTILRRGVATDSGPHRLTSALFFFSTGVAIENVHPLQAGLFRLKHRRDRRPTLPIESVWTFYPKLLWEIVVKHARYGARWLDLERMRRRAIKEAERAPYIDQALMPVTEDETDTLEMFTHNESARSEVVHTRKVAALTHGTPALAQQP